MAIQFHNQHPSFKLKGVLKIKTWIKQVISSEKKETGIINFVFLSDKELIKVNRQFLNHDTYTDIITFDYCEGKKVNSDIMISIDRVEENASNLNIPFHEELKRVMVHGILHLCGYKDKSKADKELMRKKENSALKKFR
jgi:probable rRNA maturation factor